MIDFVKELCAWKAALSPYDCLALVISLVTLIITICIPINIMKFQRYTNLTATYMSYDVAHAIKSVVDFFHDTCDSDVGQIPEKYILRFRYDFNPKNKVETSKILHYQRRLLNNYFYELEKCRESSIFLRKTVENEWTSSEAWIVKVLIFMNKVVDDTPELYKDISCIKYSRLPKTKGLNRTLEKFYNDLSKASRWINKDS